MKKRIHLIFNPVFISGLILLIVNDHILKDVYANWLTGKLSDFAGVLILPFVFKFLFDSRKSTSIFLTILFFTFWKSPISEILIQNINTFSGLHFTRVVDFSDLIAFAVLPFSYWALKHNQQIAINLKWTYVQRVAQTTVMGCAILAFIATSQDIGPNWTSITDCCQGDPVEANVGNGKIFIPTIFTPDGNGMNDFFQISVDSNIIRIDSFVVINPADGAEVFKAINQENIIPTNGYNGNVMGSVAPTTFEYTIEVTSEDGVSALFNGVVCSVPCFEKAIINAPGNYDNCAFSDQHDFINGYDPNLTPIEIQDCF